MTKEQLIAQMEEWADRIETFHLPVGVKECDELGRVIRLAISRLKEQAYTIDLQQQMLRKDGTETYQEAK